MTGEEMERAIEFLLQSQANFEVRSTAFDARLERIQGQLEETNRQISSTDICAAISSSRFGVSTP